MGAAAYNPSPPHNQLYIMPTLDDAPTIESLAEGAIADDDLIQIYDTSAGKVKTMRFDDLIDYIVSKTDASET